MQTQTMVRVWQKPLSSLTAAGGTVTLNAAHEDGKADYSAEVGALAAAGGDRGHCGLSIKAVAVLRALPDAGAFDCYFQMV